MNLSEHCEMWEAPRQQTNDENTRHEKQKGEGGKFNGTNQMKRIQRGDEYVLQAMNELMNVLNVILN